MEWNEKSQKSKDYFSGIMDDYVEKQLAIQPELYRNSAQIINQNLLGEQFKKILDIGNGGIINYDYSHFNELICGDLYLNKDIIFKYKNIPQIKFEEADIFKLPYGSNSFDAVLAQAVIHHLAGKSLAETYKNVACALDECVRVLRPNGKFIILESTVVPCFENIEKILYPFMQIFFGLCKFDSVYQFSAKSLQNFIENKKYELCETGEVPLGKHIWIMNHKVLTRVTPCRFNYYIITKR